MSDKEAPKIRTIRTGITRPAIRSVRAVDRRSGIRAVQLTPEAAAVARAASERSQREDRIRLQNRLADERRLIEAFYNENRDRTVVPLARGSWSRQRYAYGMWTCEFANAINALRFLGEYNPRVHTEESFIDVLGGREFARQNPHGCLTEEVIKSIQALAPGVKVRGTGSVAEMLRAAADGAAVMFPYSTNHEALIPPGFQLRRGTRGFEVQVANPLRDDTEFRLVEDLLAGEIINTPHNILASNHVLIIERVRPRVRTIRGR